MHRFRGRYLIAGLLLTAACARFATVDPDTVGSGYALGGGAWDSGGGITVAARVFERAGTTIVCGAWTTDRQSALTVHLNDFVVEAGSVFAGRDRLVQNLGFMKRLPETANISGAQANCIASGTPWRPEFAAVKPDIRIPQLSLVIDASSRQRVTFRPGPRPDILR